MTIWAAVFVICVPDAVMGAICVERRMEWISSFTVCQIHRPALRRLLSEELVAAGLAGASIDAGRCEPMGMPEPPGVLM